MHSGLSHYEWRAGTTIGASDIFDATRLHNSNRARKTLETELPTGQTIYVTVRAYNHAGMSAVIQMFGHVINFIEIAML